jgi:hypothetical protein
MLSVSIDEVKEQQLIMEEIFNGTWDACTQPSSSTPHLPYQPDVIISNPPVMVHTTLAEKLCVPLQIW